MNEFKVLSVKEVSFEDDRTGKPVTGQQLWLCGQTNEPGWLDGYEVVKAWIPDGDPREALVSTLQRDEIVIVEFSRRGKVTTICRA